MIKTILLNTTTRRIGGIIETIDSMYTVGQTYDGMLAVTSDGLPNVSDEELVSLWYYTTTNTWLQNTASPGIFYLWNYNLATNTYSWVLTNPSPVLSIITTVGFKQVNLSWTITDTNYPDIFYLVDISTDNFTSTLVTDKYLSYIDENTTTTARTYYLRPYWLNDVGAVVYGTIYNTGSITPSSIQSIDVATGAISGTKLASGTVNTQLAGTGVNVLNPRYTTFEEGVLPPFTTHASGTLSQDATAKYFGTKSLKIVTTGIGGYWFSPTKVNNITPNKKWILSCYVYSDTIIAAPVWGSAGVRVGITTASAYYGTGYYDGTTTSTTLTIPAGTWTRIYGVLDLTADSNTTCDIRLDSHATGKNVWFDGIMLEAKVGDLVIPSVYQEPPNFQNTYTGDLNATLGANFLNTYTIPTGTIPSSLTLTTGNYAMTYTAATGTLTKTGGLFTVANINLNAGGATTLSTVTTNIITTTSAHGYAQQNCVVYTHNGTTISGLVSGTCYYIIYLSATTFSLSATIPTATNGTGTAIVLGAVTAGTTYSFNSVDYITTTAAHGFVQGSQLRYNYSSGGTTISGLAYGSTYWAAYLSATTFALATSAVNVGALSGGVVSSINLGAMTAGTTYYFNWVGWQNSAYSANSFTGGAQVSFTTVATVAGTSTQYMVGLNSDPTLNNSYSSLDYCIYIAGGTQYIYESGVLLTKANTFSAYAVGDTFSIIYDGANLVNYYKNGSLFYSTYLKGVITTPLFLDSSFVEYGSGCTNLKFNAYSAPALLSGTNITGMIHAANALDHLSDNIISTETVIPQSISQFQSSVFSMDTSLGVIDVMTQSMTLYCGTVTVTGDKFSKILGLIGLSNLSKTLATFPVPVSISVQSQSNIHSMYNPPAISNVLYVQAATPACTATNYDNNQQWYKVSAAGGAADINYPVGQVYSPSATRQLNVIPTTAGVNITTDVFTCTIYPVWATSIYTGMQVIYYNDTAGANIAPLVYGTYYYVIKVSATTFKLATTAANATAGVAINITAVSTGAVAHTFLGGFSWLLKSTGSNFYVGNHAVIANSEVKSMTVQDVASFGDRTQDTFHMYAEFMFDNVTNALAFDNIFFDATLTIIVGKR